VTRRVGDIAFVQAVLTDAGHVTIAKASATAHIVTTGARDSASEGRE
jgi:hypothetical protein